MSRNFNEEIMGQSRHQFIYGYNTDHRTAQIKEIVAANPIKMDENAPMGIYLEENAVPDVTYDKKVDTMVASRVSKEYLSFSIAYTLLNRALEENDFEAIPERVAAFLKTINLLFVYDDHEEIKSLQELLNILKFACNYYKMHYSTTLKTGSFTGNLAELPISFLSLDTFVRYFKKMLNNNSYVAVVIESVKPISKIASQTINEYITKRCNADLSMKVVCEPSSWPTYYDLNGVMAEYIHDYGVVELDDSYKNYVSELRRKWSI